MSKLTLDILKMRHPRTGKARQTKLYLSQDMFERLHKTSHMTGIDMSAIVDTMIREILPSEFDPPAHKEPSRRPVPASVNTKPSSEQDFEIDG